MFLSYGGCQFFFISPPCVARISDDNLLRTNVFILRQSDPTGVGQSDHTQTAQFDPLEVGLNVGCDNPTHVQSDPRTIRPTYNPTHVQSDPRTIRPILCFARWVRGQFGDNIQMAILKNVAAPPERTSPKHGSAGRKLDLT
jgi:hypothetical protein